MIDSPSPVPPNLRVVEVSAWLNAWNSRADCSGVMPMPVSRTENLQLYAIGSLVPPRLTRDDAPRRVP